MNYTETSVQSDDVIKDPRRNRQIHDFIQVNLFGAIEMEIYPEPLKGWAVGHPPLELPCDFNDELQFVLHMYC